MELFCICLLLFSIKIRKQRSLGCCLASMDLCHIGRHASLSTVCLLSAVRVILSSGSSWTAHFCFWHILPQRLQNPSLLWLPSPAPHMLLFCSIYSILLLIPSLLLENDDLKTKSWAFTYWKMSSINLQAWLTI